jgi:hypothetical protein
LFHGGGFWQGKSSALGGFQPRPDADTVAEVEQHFESDKENI